MPTIRTLPLADLVEDFSLYPRHAVDEQHVRELVEALAAGATLPPIVAESGRLRIVDGFHRCRALRKALGPDAVTAVEVHDYASEAELFLDAVRRNASHGRRLDRVDQVRVITMAGNYGLDDTAIATVLQVPAPRVQTLRVRVAYDADGNNPQPLKRPVLHLAGTAITEEQRRALTSTPGTSYRLLIRQLSDAVRFGLLDLSSEPLLVELAQLADVLQAFLERHAA